MITIPRKNEFIYQAIDFIYEDEPELKELYPNEMIFSVLDKYFFIPPNAEFDLYVARTFLNDQKRIAKRFSKKNIRFKLKECLCDLFTAEVVRTAADIVQDECINWTRMIINSLICVIKGFYYKFNDGYSYYILRTLYDWQQEYITEEKLINEIIKNNGFDNTEDIKKEISNSITFLDDLGCVNIIDAKIYLEEIIVCGV